MSTPVIQQDGNRTWINNLSNKPIGESWDQWLRGLQIMLSAHGDDVSLDDLIVYSGEAFGFCHASEWELRTGLSVANDPLSSVAGIFGHTGRWIPTRFF